jgi:DNA-binding GntR family transcriptional regulator
MRHGGERTPVAVPPCPAHELETVEDRVDRQRVCKREGTRVPDAAVTLSGGVIVSSTRREEVSTRIRRALLTGELRPGQRIKEVHLAEALGVSRPTLRESLQQLVHEGALVQVPYKGIHVAQPTPDELRDVAEVRMPLETMAALRLSRNPDGPAMDGVRDACGRTSPRSGPATTSRPI